MKFEFVGAAQREERWTINDVDDDTIWKMNIIKTYLLFTGGGFMLYGEMNMHDGWWAFYIINKYEDRDGGDNLCVRVEKILDYI